MDVSGLIDRYCQVWTEVDTDRRSELPAGVWATGATYTDPSTHAVGAAELLAHIAKVQAKRPGARVLRTSEVDLHHGVVRFAWQVVQGDGVVLPEGLDLAFLIPDGAKIGRVIGFFGPLRRRTA